MEKITKLLCDCRTVKVEGVSGSRISGILSEPYSVQTDCAVVKLEITLFLSKREEREEIITDIINY